MSVSPTRRLVFVLGVGFAVPGAQACAPEAAEGPISRAPAGGGITKYTRHQDDRVNPPQKVAALLATETDGCAYRRRFSETERGQKAQQHGFKLFPGNFSISIEIDRGEDGAIPPVELKTTNPIIAIQIHLFQCDAHIVRDFPSLILCRTGGEFSW